MEIRELLEHIRDDKDVAEITHAISRIDAIQRAKFEDHTVATEERVVSEEDSSVVFNSVKVCSAKSKELNKPMARRRRK